MKKIICIGVMLLAMVLPAAGQIPVINSVIKNFTAPGVSAAIATAGYTEITYGITVANINTNVVVQCQIKQKGLGWSSAEVVNGVPTAMTITANGTVYRSWKFASTVDSARVSFDSETGGTSATITSKMMLAKTPSR